MKRNNDDQVGSSTKRHAPDSAYRPKKGIELDVWKQMSARDRQRVTMKVDEPKPFVIPEFKNKIDGEFTREYLYEGDNVWAIPEHMCVIRTWRRESELMDEQVDLIKVKSNYRIIIDDEISVMNIRSWTDLQIRTNFHGYKEIGLYYISLDKSIVYPIHQLVAFMKYGLRPGDDFTVDHINQVRDDNSWDNLRYCHWNEQALNKKSNITKASRKPIDFEFDIKNYIIVRRVPIMDKVYPYAGQQKMYLHFEGKHIVMGQKYVRNKSFQEIYPTAGIEYLCDGEKRSMNVQLHRLIWINANPDVPFIENYIDHIDGNKHNWAISNLRHVTQKQNMHYAVNEQDADFKTIPVALTNVRLNKRTEFKSITHAARWLFQLGFGESEGAMRHIVSKAIKSGELIYNSFSVSLM